MFNSNYIISIYVLVDDFLTPLIQQHPELVSKNKRGFSCAMSPSEIITLCLLFQSSGFRNFKAFYQFAEVYLKPYFPKMLSYSRFVNIKKDMAFLMFLFSTSLMSKTTGISFIDSTSIFLQK